VTDFQLGSTVLVLSVMSCLSLALSLFLHLKNRALLRLPKNLQINVFDRIFNVFDPYPERRKAMHDFLVLVPFLALVGGFVSVYLAVGILAMGLVLGLVAFIFCLSLMMVDEVFEIHKNANFFLKAVNSGAGFGVGDLAVLLLLKKTLPKLRAYHLFLSIIFLACLASLPYMVPAGVFALGQAVGMMIEFSASAGTLAPFGTIFLLASVEVVAYATVRRVKSRIFGFPPSHSLISATSATARTKISYENLGDIFEEQPEEMTY
jgi:hypothetical protein